MGRPMVGYAAIKLVSVLFRPLSISRAPPKRQRTGAVQDLADFPAASNIAKRLGVRWSSATFYPERAEAKFGPGSTKVTALCVGVSASRQRLEFLQQFP